jgi:hypothetical protein
MTPMQPEQPIQVTLQAQQWNTVLAALNEAPHRIARPVIDAILSQVQAEADKGDAALPAKLNGAEAHAPH